MGSVEEENRSQKCIDMKVFRLDAGNAVILVCSSKLEWACACSCDLLCSQNLNSIGQKQKDIRCIWCEMAVRKHLTRHAI